MKGIHEALVIVIVYIDCDHTIADDSSECHIAKYLNEDRILSLE